MNKQANNKPDLAAHSKTSGSQEAAATKSKSQISEKMPKDNINTKQKTLQLQGFINKK